MLLVQLLWKKTKWWIDFRPAWIKLKNFKQNFQFWNKEIDFNTEVRKFIQEFKYQSLNQVDKIKSLMDF